MSTNSIYHPEPTRDPLAHLFKEGICKYCKEPLTEENYGQFCDARFKEANENVRLADEQRAASIKKFLEKQGGGPFMLAGVDAVSVANTDAELCEHVCKCGKGWSHGLSSKCRVPHEFSPCPDCLSIKIPPSQVKEETKKKLLNKEVEIRNDEMWNPHNLTLPVGGVAKMSLEEIQAHIDKMQEVMEELRIRSMTARSQRAEKMKELGLTDEDRADFNKKLKQQKQEKVELKKATGKDKAERDVNRALNSFIKMFMVAGMSEEAATKKAKMAMGEDL